MSGLQIIIVGVGACVIFDLWQRVFYWLTDIPPTNWSIVGRWTFGLMTKGQLIASDIESQSERQNELLLGWAVHYVIALGYATIYAFLMLLGVVETGVVDGILFGVTSVIVPWFFFLPCLGKGVMARLTPKPLRVCLMALMMHSLFGFSLGVGFQIFAL